MKYLSVALLLVLVFPAFPSADYLVWKTGAVLTIAGDFRTLDRSEPMLNVTAVDDSGRRARIYVSSFDIDWRKTADFNTAEKGWKPSADTRTGMRESDIPTESPPAPEPEANKPLMIIEEESYRHFGQVFVEGKIQNFSGRTVENLEVTAHFYDGYDNEVDVITVSAHPELLYPGEVAEFSVMAANSSMSSKITQYELKLNWE